MPSSLCDLGPCLNEFGDDLFLEYALNSPCNLESVGHLMLGAIPSQSPTHPSTEDSFYPPDNTPVLSDEIWKKFDLPEDEASTQWPSTEEDSWDLNSMLPPTLSVAHDSGKFQVCTGKELRHHDCMWTGECKNKEHVRSKAIGEQRVVAPGQTLLKNPVLKDLPSTVPSVMMKSPSPMLTASPTVLRVPQRGGVVSRTPTGKSVLLRTSRGAGRPGEAVSARVVTLRLPEDKESRGGKKGSFDGSSPRPETPLSLSEEEDEEPAKWGRGQSAEDVEQAEAAAAFEEALALLAAEDEDSVKEEEEECGKAVSMAEVSGQVRVTSAESNACHLDHDYHMSGSKGAAVKTDHLGVQTPSDSEEEIDVVGWNGGDKSAVARATSAATRPTAGKAVSGRGRLPTNPSARDKHQLQLTVQAAIAKVSANAAFEEDDEDDESSEEDEESEEEDEYEYDSSECTARGKSNGAKRHAEDAGPAPKQSRVGHHHKRRRKSPRDDDPDYDGPSVPSWSYSTSSYLSSSSSGTSSPPRRRGTHRKRSHRHHHEGGDSAPEDPLERRSMHNTMERQRRIDLRNAFESLRLLVPSVAEKERSAKVTILREAAVYCTHLGSQESKQTDSIKALRARQVALRAQVSSLRKSLAASR